MAAILEQVAKATKDFLELVKETQDPHFQGYHFIEYALLSICKASFRALTKEETLRLVRAIGFAVVESSSIDNEYIEEPMISLDPSYSETDLVKEVKRFLKEEGLDGHL